MTIGSRSSFGKSFLETSGASVDDIQVTENLFVGTKGSGL